MKPVQTITVTMTVKQFDIARGAARAAAKKRARDAENGHPEFAEKNQMFAADLKRIVTIISDAMRDQIGEADYNALGFEHIGNLRELYR